VPAELRRLAADEWLAPSARASAVAGLALVNRERLENARFVASLLSEESFHLRRAALRALASFDDPGSRRALRDSYPRARTAEERRIIEAGLARPGP
jgi:HEAT repeat protein